MSLQGNSFEKKAYPTSVLVLSHPVKGHVKIKDIYTLTLKILNVNFVKYKKNTSSLILLAHQKAY